MNRRLLSCVSLSMMIWLSSGLHCAVNGKSKKEVPQLTPAQVQVQNLKFKENARQLAAMDELTEMGAEALPALLEAVDNKDVEVRLAAIEVLGRIGTKARSATPKLIELVDDKNPHLRYGAIWSLGEIGSPAKAAIPKLIDGLSSTDDKCQIECVQALGKFGKQASAAVKPISELALSSKDTELRIAAMEALPLIKTDIPLETSTLQKCILDKNERITQVAITAVAEFGHDGKSAVPDIVSLISSKDSPLKREAIQALGKIGTQPDVVIPLLQKELNNPKTAKSREIRLISMRALSGFGADAKTAETEIDNALASSDAEMILAAARVVELGKLGSDANSKALNQAATNTSAAVRASCARAIGVQKQLTELSPVLIRLLKDDSPVVRCEAALAVSELGIKQKSVIPVLTSLLNDEDIKVRYNAILCLGMYGPDASTAVPDLTKSLGNDDTGLRQRAAWCLGKIGTEAKPALPELIKALSNGSPSVKQSSAQAIGHLGLEATDALPALTKSLKSSTPEVRRSSVWALGMIGTGAKKAIPDVEKAKDDSDEQVRKLASQALVKIGPPEPDPPPPQAVENMTGADGNATVPPAGQTEEKSADSPATTTGTRADSPAVPVGSDVTKGTAPGAVKPPASSNAEQSTPSSPDHPFKAESFDSSASSLLNVIEKALKNSPKPKEGDAESKPPTTPAAPESQWK